MNRENLILNIIVFFLSISMAEAQFVSPMMQFLKEEHDFGKVRQGEIVEYVFQFINAGEDTLKVIDISTSCGCAAGLLTKKEYAPKDTGFLRVKFDSYGKLGNQVHRIYIRTNDIFNPLTVLIVRAYVYLSEDKSSDRPKPIILLEKTYYDFGKIKDDETYSVNIPLKNIGDDVLIIGEVISNCSCIEAIPKSRRIQPRKSSELKVMFNPTNLIGMITRTIQIFTNDPHNRVVYLTIQGEVYQ